MAKDEKKKKKSLLTKARQWVRTGLLAGEGKGTTVGSQVKQMENLGLLTDEEKKRIAERRKKLAKKRAKK